MFFPLLKAVSGEHATASMEMGNLAYLVHGIEQLGVSMTLTTILLFMVAFFCFKGLAKYLQEIYLIILRQRFIKNIRTTLLNLMRQLNFKYFITSDVGRIQNTMTGEVERVSNAFHFYMKTLQEGIMVAVYISFAFILDPGFAILVCIGGGLTTLLYRALYKRTQEASRQLTDHNSTYQGEVLQLMGHFKYLKATGNASLYTRRLKNTVHAVEQSRREIGMLTSIATAVREPMLVTIVAIVIFFQIRFFDGAIGAIIVSLLFFYRSLTSLTSMQQCWNFFLEFSGSLENMKCFQYELQHHQQDKKTVKAQPFTRAIHLNNVDLYYGDKKILHDITLTIARNQSIALVGESGSGKSTLVNLISGLLTPDTGTILIDDQDLSLLDLESYQQQLGYVSQDPVIFNDSIFNNVTFWADYTEETLTRFNKAVKQARLKDFIHQLHHQEHTLLGNNGITLSGGQRQRISIARELYKEVDILMLDEATSALDSETEGEIQASIDRLKGHYTLIIIAHRLATIKNVDQIVMMANGRIQRIGTFTELLTHEPEFKRIVKLQTL